MFDNQYWRGVPICAYIWRPNLNSCQTYTGFAIKHKCNWLLPWFRCILILYVTSPLVLTAREWSHLRSSLNQGILILKSNKMSGSIHILMKVVELRLCQTVEALKGCLLISDLLITPDLEVACIISRRIRIWCTLALQVVMTVCYVWFAVCPAGTFSDAEGATACKSTWPFTSDYCFLPISLFM